MQSLIDTNFLKPTAGIIFLAVIIILSNDMTPQFVYI